MRVARPMDGTAASVSSPLRKKGGEPRPSAPGFESCVRFSPTATVLQVIRSFLRRRSAELAPQADEQGLERERRRELELLRLAPRGPHELASPLGGEEPLAGAVGAKLVEAVDVHDGGLRSGRDDDEVPVPPFELLERREELVALGAPLGPPDALLRLAAG